MLKEKYLTYKLEYKDYIVLLKCGNFYISLDNDAIVMSIVFCYKIKEFGNYIKVGFPLLSLNKVLNKLNDQEINYIVIDESITVKQKFRDNKYNDYGVDYEYNKSRIDSINKLLIKNLNKKYISKVIGQIENIVCRINY